MRTKFTLIAVSATLLAALPLAGCDRNDKQTAGQGLDKAIGQVKDQGESAKAATEEAAKSVASSAADAGITVKVNAALVADTRLKVMQVNVDTRDGRVTLTGVAPDAQARDKSTALIKAIEGVVDVDNRLRVEPKP
jgi:hyperosmotically inducible periplasmic protein